MKKITFFQRSWENIQRAYLLLLTRYRSVKMKTFNIRGLLNGYFIVKPFY